MRPIYITGHKNPDTDSIVSSIAYARYIKNKGKHAIASRIGPVSSDTEYLLNRFGFEDPLHIYTAKSTIREIDFDEAIRRGRMYSEFEKHAYSETCNLFSKEAR